jgi:hypothetical protein
MCSVVNELLGEELRLLDFIMLVVPASGRGNHWLVRGPQLSAGPGSLLAEVGSACGTFTKSRWLSVR